MSELPSSNKCYGTVLGCWRSSSLDAAHGEEERHPTGRRRHPKGRVHLHDDGFDDGPQGLSRTREV